MDPYGEKADTIENKSYDPSISYPHEPVHQNEGLKASFDVESNTTTSSSSVSTIGNLTCSRNVSAESTPDSISGRRASLFANPHPIEIHTMEPVPTPEARFPCTGFSMQATSTISSLAPPRENRPEVLNTAAAHDVYVYAQGEAVPSGGSAKDYSAPAPVPMPVFSRNWPREMVTGAQRIIDPPAEGEGKFALFDVFAHANPTTLRGTTVSMTWKMQQNAESTRRSSFETNSPTYQPESYPHTQAQLPQGYGSLPVCKPILLTTPSGAAKEAEFVGRDFSTADGVRGNAMTFYDALPIDREYSSEAAEFLPKTLASDRYIFFAGDKIDPKDNVPQPYFHPVPLSGYSKQSDSPVGVQLNSNYTHGSARVSPASPPISLQSEAAATLIASLSMMVPSQTQLLSASSDTDPQFSFRDACRSPQELEYVRDVGTRGTQRHSYRMALPASRLCGHSGVNSGNRNAAKIQKTVRRILLVWPLPNVHLIV